MKTTSFIKIACLALLGLFISCEEKEDDENTCPEFKIEREIQNEDGSSSIFKVSDDTNGQFMWYVNDELVLEIHADNNRAELAYSFPEAGTYTICAKNLNDECDAEIEACLEVIYDGKDDTVDACPDLSITKSLISNDGLTYKFIASGAPESRYSWFINDEYVQTVLEGDNDKYLTYEFSENGIYSICVGVETPECPKGVKTCVELEIKDVSEITCTLDFETIFKPSDDISIQKVVFEAFGSVSNSDAKYFWIINDKDIKSDNSARLENIFYKNGTYQVCVFTETPECPNGIEYCKEVIVDNIVENTQPAFNITVDNPVQEKTVEACVDLTYDYSISSDNVNKYVLEATLFEDMMDSNYVWYINKNNADQDVYIGSGRVFEYEFTEVGEYTIRAFVETPECPMGVTFSKDYKVEYIMVN